MQLEQPAIDLIRAAISKAVEENSRCISLREVIILGAHTYLQALREKLNVELGSEELPAVYENARTTLQEFVGIFGIKINIEEFKKEVIANDNNGVPGEDNLGAEKTIK